MRILVVIPHYFGPKTSDDTHPIHGSEIEPIGRIAGFNAMMMGLHGNFGPECHTLEGAKLYENSTSQPQLNIVILTMRDRHLLSEIGIEPSTYTVEFVDDKLRIPFHASRVFKERLGRYDFYCLIEDDLIIHDRAFFEKLTWFQENFGPKALLAPVRFELSSTGNPAKVIIDPELQKSYLAPFRRPGQREEIIAEWNGRHQSFRLPNNPHAGCYFLTNDQLAYWIDQPSFDDGDTSWIGPLESGVTLGIGKVFDIYKPSAPDRLFLEIEHFGGLYALRFAPSGSRYGEPPLVAMAQNAMRAAIASTNEPAGRSISPPASDLSFASLARRWIAQGTSVGSVAQVQRATYEIQHLHAQIGSMTVQLEQKAEEILQLQSQVGATPTRPHDNTEKMRLIDRVRRFGSKASWLYEALFKGIRAILKGREK